MGDAVFFPKLLERVKLSFKIVVLWDNLNLFFLDTLFFLSLMNRLNF